MFHDFSRFVYGRNEHIRQFCRIVREKRDKPIDWQGAWRNSKPWTFFAQKRWHWNDWNNPFGFASSKRCAKQNCLWFCSLHTCLIWLLIPMYWNLKNIGVVSYSKTMDRRILMRALNWKSVQRLSTKPKFRSKTEAFAFSSHTIKKTKISNFRNQIKICHGDRRKILPYIHLKTT